DRAKPSAERTGINLRPDLEAQSGHLGRGWPRRSAPGLARSQEEGVPAPSVRKPTVACWAQSRGQGRSEPRGSFRPPWWLPDVVLAYIFAAIGLIPSRA